jgi:flagellar biosynthesis protein FliQ
MGNFDVVIEPLRAFLVQVGAYLPRLAVAVVVLIAGWLIAKAIRFAAVKALRALNFNVLTQRAGIDAFLQQGGTERDTTDVFGAVIYWVVVLVALVIAFNGLGLTHVTELLTRVLLFLPKLLVGLLVLIFGAYFGRFVGNAVQTYFRNVGVSDADLLGRIAQYAIVVFVVLIAVDQLDIGGDLVQNTFLILLAGVVLALALAFGLGGRDWAAAMLARWFPQRGREDK